MAWGGQHQFGPPRKGCTVFGGQSSPTAAAQTFGPRLGEWRTHLVASPTLPYMLHLPLGRVFPYPGSTPQLSLLNSQQTQRPPKPRPCRPAERGGREHSPWPGPGRSSFRVSRPALLVILRPPPRPRVCMDDSRSFLGSRVPLAHLPIHSSQCHFSSDTPVPLRGLACFSITSKIKLKSPLQKKGGPWGLLHPDPTWRRLGPLTFGSLLS